MSKKLSHTLVGGRTVVGTGGQGLKIGSEGRLYWKDIDEESLIPVAWLGDRGIYMGGTILGGGFTNIDYINITSTGDGTDFGDLTVGRLGKAGASDGSRGLMLGGTTTAWSSHGNTIDYITIASTGNAIDFGDLTVARGGLAGCSNGTRAIATGGQT